MLKELFNTILGVTKRVTVKVCSILFIVTFYVFGLVACQSGPPPINPYEQKFMDAGVRSILVVPVVNKSVDVEAPTSVLSSLPRVLGNKGYYVFGVNTAKVVLEFEGLTEPEQVHQADSIALASTFGADSILYVEIERWTSQYVLLATTTIIDLKYRLVDRAGQELWVARKQLTHTPRRSTDGGSLLANLIADAVVAAVEKAKPKYMELTRMANDQVFLSGRSELPEGPYLRAWKAEQQAK